MKKAHIANLLIAGCALLLLISGCTRSIPVLTTSPVTKIGVNTAECGGIITFAGAPEYSSYGICWNTKPNPTIASRRTAHLPAKSAEFVNPLGGLAANTTYFIRAYATNAAGTAYGEQVSFTTAVSVPIMGTSFVSDITYNSAISGSIIFLNGGSHILNYGFCWDTVPKPTINASKTIDSLGTDIYLNHLRGLKPNKTYFVRAYATNSVGTGYGLEKTFTTPKTVPLLMTTPVSDISTNAATCGAKLITDGGTSIIENGICWSLKTDPTTADSITKEYYRPGKFRMTKLKAGARYYVRAFATNSSGTGYGTLMSFKTLGNTPSATTLDAVNLLANGAVLKGTVTANHFSSTISFEFGKTSESGYTKVVPLSPVTGTSDVLVSKEISGLEMGTTYHYRIKASNELGTTYGKDLTFTTLKIPSLSNFYPINKNYKDTTFSINQPTSNSPGAFSYSSSNPKVAIVKGSQVIITGSGTCTLTATQAPHDNFTSGDISTMLTMNLTDVDGNVYHTVSIGEQDWMKENLKVTRYRDRTPISYEPDNKEWTLLTNGAFCWYNNDPASLETNNGALYNWYAVDSPHHLCPAGWHVPSDSEWKELELYLGMTVDQAEGTIKRSPGIAVNVKDTLGWIKAGNGTNTSDFSALAGGFRLYSTGVFSNSGLDGCWWTATEDNEKMAWLRNMYYSLNDIFRTSDNKNFGISVRCIRDK